MKRILRITAVCLAVLLAATAFTGCFGGGKKAPEKQTVDKVYKYETTELLTFKRPQLEEGEQFQGETQIGTFSLDKDGYLYTVQKSDENYTVTELTAHVGTYGSDTTVQIPLPIQDDENGYRGVRDIARVPDGLLVTVYENIRVENGKEWYYENKFLAEVYNTDGSLRSSMNLNELFDQPENREGKYYFGINNVYYGLGDLFVTTYGSDESLNRKIFRFGLDGTEKGVIELMPEGTEGYVQNVRFLGENKLLAPVEIYGDNYTQKMVTVDLITGERTETDAGTNYEVMYRSFVGADGGVYYASENGVYAFDLATGEETLLMDFINSDYIYESGNFYAVSKDEFVALNNIYGEEEISLELTAFTKVPDDQLVPKYLITVASAGGAYNFRDQIIEFNLASEEYRIKYLDYSQYNTEEDYRAGQTKLQNDIIAGLIPDVLITDQEFSAAKYANKGLFADLYTYMDQDTELTRDKFLPNVLSACETGGKLYEIPTNIYLMGFVGAAERIGEFDNLTVREFVEKVSALPEGTSFFREGDYSRDELLRIFFSVNYNDYIDPATGLCRLNNDDFKAMLEWLGTQPEKSRWEQEDFNYETFDYQAYENMYKEGKAIAQMASLDSFSSLQNYAYTFGDAELDFIGVPAPDRDGMAFTATSLKFLVSAKGNFPEQAWNFVKVFFTEENQRELGWGFPVIQSALDAEKQEMLDRIAEWEARQEEGDAVVPRAGAKIGGTRNLVYPMERRYATREDVEKIYTCVLNAKKQLRYDDSILDIIKEEASEYFGGKKSLDNVAAQAESRVNIKLGEQM